MLLVARRVKANDCAKIAQAAHEAFWKPTFVTLMTHDFGRSPNILYLRHRVRKTGDPSDADYQNLHFWQYTKYRVEKHDEAKLAKQANQGDKRNCGATRNPPDWEQWVEVLWKCCGGFAGPKCWPSPALPL